MKKIYAIALPAILLLFLFGPQYLSAGQSPTLQPFEPGFSNPVPNLNNMSAADFMGLSPKEIQNITGEKLSLRDRLVLRQVQYQVHRKLKKGENFNLEELYSLEDRKFSFGGFLLGFFLGIIGLLIAILFGRDAVRSALYGMICNAIIVLIAIAAGNA